MILVDANILLYAYDATSVQHSKARVFWEGALSHPAPVRLSWATVGAFLRLATHPRVFANPMTIEEAAAHVGSWRACPMFEILDPTERHWEVLSRLLVAAQATANLVPDAQLAALAIEHGALLCSTDRDFSRFPGLAWRNPLED